MLKCFQCLFRHQCHTQLCSCVDDPWCVNATARRFFLRSTNFVSVDLWGLEPQTFGMQIRRSSQLSYRPFAYIPFLFKRKKNTADFSTVCLPRLIYIYIKVLAKISVGKYRLFGLQVVGMHPIVPYLAA